MAAVSAPQAPSALTPPSSSQGGQSWNYSVPTHSEVSINTCPRAVSPLLAFSNPSCLQTSSQSKANDFKGPPLTHTNGHSLGRQNSRTDLSQRRTDTYNSGRSAETGYLAPARVNALTRKDSSISDTGSAPDSLLDLYGPNRSGLNSIDYGDRKPAIG